ncbi:MAG: hypothetical protein KYX66_12435 [Blastomonas fulva]|uniref:hypothetical protein n=1 Tax=Blastomonas fulva TaxID=1550728 RepID=UPI0024E215D6|nr:hypothetical protein [Blastomonas fulva]MDK2757533.1 hypothetical protein [Blastomonas fulva]
MSRTMLACAALMLPAAAAAGPISKWDDRAPEFDYVSRANLHDVERCILDANGWPLPMVYRQPDRPDSVTLMYVDGTGLAAGRIDLKVIDNILHVKAWDAPKAIIQCAPRSEQ